MKKYKLLNKGRREKCDICGNNNVDVVSVEYNFKKIFGIFNMNEKINICQSCGSRIFRGFNKTK